MQEGRYKTRNEFYIKRYIVIEMKCSNALFYSLSFNVRSFILQFSNERWSTMSTWTVVTIEEMKIGLKIDF